MKTATLVTLMAMFSLWLAASAIAEGVDGSSPLVCDLAEVAQCDGVAECEDVTVSQIDLPPVVLVDFEAKQLASEDGERTSPIVSVEKLDEVLLLQGHQNGRGWTLVIDRASGHLTATMADAEGAFVLAGACTAR
jgi:hypothetical protein